MRSYGAEGRPDGSLVLGQFGPPTPEPIFEWARVAVLDDLSESFGGRVRSCGLMMLDTQVKAASFHVSCYAFVHFLSSFLSQTST